MEESLSNSLGSTGSGTSNTERAARARVEAAHRALFGIRVGSLNLLLSAHEVQAVTNAEPPTRAPGAPDYITGLVPHGDGALAILDLGKFLGVPRDDSHLEDLSMYRVVSVKVGELEAGLLCEQATGVTQVHRSLIAPATVIKGGRIREFVSEEVELDGKCFGLLDLQPMLEAARVRSRREG